MCRRRKQTHPGFRQLPAVTCSPRRYTRWQPQLKETECQAEGKVEAAALSSRDIGTSWLLRLYSTSQARATQVRSVSQLFAPPGGGLSRQLLFTPYHNTSRRQRGLLGSKPPSGQRVRTLKLDDRVAGVSPARRALPPSRKRLFRPAGHASQRRIHLRSRRARHLWSIHRWRPLQSPHPCHSRSMCLRCRPRCCRQSPGRLPLRR